LSDKIFLLPL